MKLDMIPSYIQGSIEMENHYLSVNHQSNQHPHSQQHYANNYLNQIQNNNNLEYLSYGQQHSSNENGSTTSGDIKRLKTTFSNYDQSANNAPNEQANTFTNNQEVSRK